MPTVSGHPHPAVNRARSTAASVSARALTHLVVRVNADHLAVPQEVLTVTTSEVGDPVPAWATVDLVAAMTALDRLHVVAPLAEKDQVVSARLERTRVAPVAAVRNVVAQLP